MSQQEWKKGRVSIEKSASILHITVPTIKNVSLIIFLIASLGIWFLGEKIIISLILSFSVLKGYDYFFLLWFIGWTACGFFFVS